MAAAKGSASNVNAVRMRLRIMIDYLSDEDTIGSVKGGSHGM